jgi:hypothetical protein
MIVKSPIFSRFARGALFTLIVAVGLSLADEALAYNPNVKTLGDMTNSVYNSIVSLQVFLSVISYVLGVFFSITGLQQLRNYVDDPGRNPAHAALLRLGAAAFFVFSPSAANILVNTLSGQSTGTSGVGFAAAPTVEERVDPFDANNAGDGLDQAFGRFVVDIASPLLDNALPIFSYVVGVIFMLVGLKRLALANGEGPQAPGGLGTMGTFLIGAALMSSGYVMYSLQGSIFGTTIMYSNTHLVTSIDPDMAERANQTLWAIFIFLRIVGYVSVLRGLFMLRALAEGGRESMVGVMTHLIAGALLANGGLLVDSIQCTFVHDASMFAFDTITGC